MYGNKRPMPPKRVGGGAKPRTLGLAKRVRVNKAVATTRQKPRRMGTMGGPVAKKMAQKPRRMGY
jgi:hypothetical protein